MGYDDCGMELWVGRLDGFVLEVKVCSFGWGGAQVSCTTLTVDVLLHGDVLSLNGVSTKCNGYQMMSPERRCVWCRWLHGF